MSRKPEREPPLGGRVKVVIHQQRSPFNHWKPKPDQFSLPWKLNPFPSTPSSR